MTQIKEWAFIWYKAVRGPFLVMSVLPVLLGGVIAVQDSRFNGWFLLLVLLGVLLAHAAADLFDDFYDYRTGNAGSKDHKFHDSPLFKGQLTIRQVLFSAVFCTGVAAAIGIYLLVEVGMPVLYLTLGGAFILFFYTAPPLRLNYNGLGEIVIFLAFGPMIIFGTYYVVTGHPGWEPVIASIAPGIFTMNVGLISNIFDYEDDLAHDKQSIPVRFGRQAGMNVLIFGNVAAYLTIILGVVFQILPIGCLIALLGIPLSINAIKWTRLHYNMENIKPARLNAIKLAALSSLLLGVGYLLELLPL